MRELDFEDLNLAIKFTEKAFADLSLGFLIAGTSLKELLKSFGTYSKVEAKKDRNRKHYERMMHKRRKNGS
jgi:hypothetical protein